MSNTTSPASTSRPRAATGPFKPTLSVVTAAMATVIIWHWTDMPIIAANDNSSTPPKSPPPAVAGVRRAANDNLVFGGPTRISGSGHANYMTEPLPDGNIMKWVTTSRGKRFQANPKSAQHLLAFVDDLEAAGAPINKIEGYTPRRIAGSARWSQHAFGNAIDIDQVGRNWVNATFGTWARSHPEVIRAAARKHGIISGGDWRNPDFGHFEWGGSDRELTSDHSIPASIRFNNPGAQYPAEWAKAFSMDGYGIIGGGHLIAHFPDAVAGAAANMFLLKKSYAGMTIGAAGTKWTGGNSSGGPGYAPNKLLTQEILNDPSFMIPFMKAIAEREAGRKSPLTDDQWTRAFKAYQTGKFSPADVKATS